MRELDFDVFGKRIWVAGHRGMVGSAIVRRLQSEGCTIMTVGREAVDQRRQSEVEDWLAEARPDAIIVAAATVGGILANDSRPAEFIYDNLMIESNIINSAYKNGVKKLLFLGSSCIYPKLAKQPITEEELLTGPLEPTNQWYAVAKIAGIKLCQAYNAQYGCNFISAMPTNLYGPGDNFDLTSGHVLPSLLTKIHNAKENNAPTVEIWGTGTPYREFLFVDDLADAAVFLLKSYTGDIPLNVGTGKDVTIRGLAEIITEVVGYSGAFVFDTGKPDGTPRKLLDVSRIRALGWQARTELREGIQFTYDWRLSMADSAIRA